MKVHRTVAGREVWVISPDGSQAAAALKGDLALPHPFFLSPEEPRGHFLILFKKEPWIRDLIPFLFKVRTRRSHQLTFSGCYFLLYNQHQCQYRQSDTALCWDAASVDGVLCFSLRGLVSPRLPLRPCG